MGCRGGCGKGLPKVDRREGDGVIGVAEADKHHLWHREGLPFAACYLVDVELTHLRAEEADREADLQLASGLGLGLGLGSEPRRLIARQTSVSWEDAALS